MPPPWLPRPPPTHTMQIREGKRGAVVVEGVLERPVTTVDEALALVARGDHNRKVCSLAGRPA